MVLAMRMTFVVVVIMIVIVTHFITLVSVFFGGHGCGFSPFSLVDLTSDWFHVKLFMSGDLSGFANLLV